MYLLLGAAGLRLVATLEERTDPERWLEWEATLAATLLVSISSPRSSMEDILELSAPPPPPLFTPRFPAPTCRTSRWRTPRPGLLTMLTPVSISICRHL